MVGRDGSRSKFTEDEKSKMEAFLCSEGLDPSNPEHDQRCKSTSIWKKAELEGVTGHSWEAMRQHYRTTLAANKYKPSFKPKGTRSSTEADEPQVQIIETERQNMLHTPRIERGRLAQELIKAKAQAGLVAAPLSRRILELESELREVEDLDMDKMQLNNSDLEDQLKTIDAKIVELSDTISRLKTEKRDLSCPNRSSTYAGRFLQSAHQKMLPQIEHQAEFDTTLRRISMGEELSKSDDDNEVDVVIYASPEDDSQNSLDKINFKKYCHKRRGIASNDAEIVFERCDSYEHALRVIDDLEFDIRLHDLKRHSTFYQFTFREGPPLETSFIDRLCERHL